MTLNKILTSIDISEMETNWIDLSNMCKYCFNIYEYVEQQNNFLTYCYYHKWTCTDTVVGIKVYYLYNKPICISYQPYSKSQERFMWISKQDFEKTKKYVYTLICSDEIEFDLVNDNLIDEICKKFDKLEYKKFEEKNIL